MKVGYHHLLNAVAALDPAAFSAVKMVKLVMANGTSFQADDITVNGQVIYARRKGDRKAMPPIPDRWAMIPREELSHIEAEFDPDDLENDVEPTLAGVIEWGSKR